MITHCCSFVPARLTIVGRYPLLESTDGEEGSARAGVGLVDLKVEWWDNGHPDGVSGSSANRSEAHDRAREQLGAGDGADAAVNDAASASEGASGMYDHSWSRSVFLEGLDGPPTYEQSLSSHATPEMLNVWGSFRFDRDRSSSDLFESAAESKKASGLYSIGDSTENGLQQLVQMCPGAQQLIAQGLKKDVPPATAIHKIAEVHMMVSERRDDDKDDVQPEEGAEEDASVPLRFTFHLRLINNVADAKFKTKWSLVDSFHADGKMEFQPEHGYRLTVLLVNDVRDSAQIIMQRLNKVNDTIRIFCTTVFRFYPKHKARHDAAKQGELDAEGGTVCPCVRGVCKTARTHIVHAQNSAPLYVSSAKSADLISSDFGTWSAGHEANSVCVVSGEDWDQPHFFEHQVREGCRVRGGEGGVVCVCLFLCTLCHGTVCMHEAAFLLLLLHPPSSHPLTSALPACASPPTRLFCLPVPWECQFSFADGLDRALFMQPESC